MANDTFTNTNGTALDTHNSDWTAASPSSTMDFEIQSNAAQSTNGKKWTNPIGVMNTGGDADISELVGLDLTNGASSGYNRPACRMSTTSRGYNVSISENGTNITALAINRHTTSSVASTGAISVGDATNCDVAVTAEDESGDVRVKVYVDQAEELSFLDTDAAKITSGTGSGWLAYAAGTTGTDAVSEWRDTVGGEAGGGLFLPYFPGIPNTLLRM